MSSIFSRPLVWTSMFSVFATIAIWIVLFKFASEGQVDGPEIIVNGAAWSALFLSIPVALVIKAFIHKRIFLGNQILIHAVVTGVLTTAISYLMLEAFFRIMTFF